MSMFFLISALLCYYITMKSVEIVGNYSGSPAQGVLRYILDRDAQVTYLGLRFGQSILFWVNHLYTYFIVPEVLHYLLGLNYGLK